jgi:histidine ammonia-lyase
MDLEGMNSSVTPLVAPVQDNRPFPWINADASRVLRLIKGSYLFKLDQLSKSRVPYRIIQDPESLRALSQRDGSAWEAWNNLQRDLMIQLNSSDHNPAVTPGWSRSSAPDLNTPWLRQYYVKGGKDDSHCKGPGVGPGTGCRHGYILSNANWDPYPIDNEIETLTNDLANVAVNDDMVPLRFENTFFTVIPPSYGLTAKQQSEAAFPFEDYTLADLLQAIHTLQNPVPVEGNSIVSNVEDLQAEGSIKVARAQQMVSDMVWLEGEDLLMNTYWMNIRQIQGQKLHLHRTFGPGPTAAWTAFRKVVPFLDAHRPPTPMSVLAYRFVLRTSPTRFFPPGVGSVP